MKQLWAPWRIDYILSAKESKCIFCSIQENKENDEENLVLYRGEFTYIVMNKYPYNSGHLLIIPYRHIHDVLEVNPQEYQEIWYMQNLSVQILRKGLNAQGCNIGINLGSVAGAGIESHLHIHVVPRWANDSSFLPVLADVRVIPEHLRSTYQKLLQAIKEAICAI